jgi:hypothetical protein
MTIIIILILFLSTLFFVYVMNDRRDKVEKDRVRELVLALKSKDVQEYSLVLPPNEDVNIPVQEESDLIPLEEIDPEELLKIKR